jgi:hypothetical protein
MSLIYPHSVLCLPQICSVARDGNFKLLWSLGIDSKESIPPAYVACRAGTTSLSYSVPGHHRLLKNSSNVFFLFFTLINSSL